MIQENKYCSDVMKKQRIYNEQKDFENSTKC